MSSKLKIERFLKTIDIFSTPVSIKFNKSDEIKSSLGGLFTIIVAGLCIAFIITTGERFFKKIQPVVNRNLQYLPTAQNHTLSDGELSFYFNFGISDEKYPLLFDKKNFNFKIYNYLRYKTFDSNNEVISTRVRTEMEWEFCKDNYEFYVKNFTNKNKIKKESLLNFNESICIKNTTFYNELIIGGEYNSNFFSNIYFELNRCINETDTELVCNSLDEINEIIYGANFQVNFIQHDPNIDSIKNPFYSFLSNYWIKFDVALLRFTDLYFIPLELESDIGLIFESLVSEKKFKFFSSLSNNEYILNQGTNTLLQIYINIGTNYEKINRYYMKFQEFSALIGGLIEIMMVSSELITSFFNKFLLEEEMINSFFLAVDNLTNNIIEVDSFLLDDELGNNSKRYLKDDLDFQNRPKISFNRRKKSFNSFNLNNNKLSEMNNEKYNENVEKSNKKQVKFRSSEKDNDKVPPTTSFYNIINKKINNSLHESINLLKKKTNLSYINKNHPSMFKKSNFDFYNSIKINETSKISSHSNLKNKKKSEIISTKNKGILENLGKKNNNILNLNTDENILILQNYKKEKKDDMLSLKENIFCEKINQFSILNKIQHSKNFNESNEKKENIDLEKLSYIKEEKKIENNIDNSRYPYILDSLKKDLQDKIETTKNYNHKKANSLVFKSKLDMSIYPENKSQKEYKIKEKSNLILNNIFDNKEKIEIKTEGFNNNEKDKSQVKHRKSVILKKAFNLNIKQQQKRSSTNNLIKISEEGGDSQKYNNQTMNLFKNYMDKEFKNRQTELQDSNLEEKSDRSIDLIKNKTSDYLKAKSFYHISYIEIIGITLCPCLNSIKKVVKKHNRLVEILSTISDYEEVCSEIALIKENRKIDYEQNLDLCIK